jgi:hypothetical protein
VRASPQRVDDLGRPLREHAAELFDFEFAVFIPGEFGT